VFDVPCGHCRRLRYVAGKVLEIEGWHSHILAQPPLKSSR
jgi:hypothetical protein